MSMNSRKTRLNVLVVEDSVTQAELLRHSLASQGYRVTVAMNGQQALAVARREPPSLVITDVVMPGMNGYDLCRALKADAELKDVPVIIVTSLKEMDDIVTALECGADNFIRKPYDPQALIARIEYLMANRQLRSHSKLQLGIEISLAGKRHHITADREQILDLLFSSYEEAVHANEELRQRQNEIQSLNLKLAARAVELEEANRQLRSFSHTVSHDLRSPLATVNGFSTVLLERHADKLDERGQRYLASIRQEAQRMTRIVEDILYLANIEHTRVNGREVDLALLAMEAVAALREAEPQRQVEFECVEAAKVRCDERLMRVALVNLIANAWKFTGKAERARISFTATRQGKETVFCVRDNGAGFDMAHAARLFVPFERLHTQAEYPGFGVGLATVQRVIVLHGGRVWAEARPGEGAAFHFVLGDAPAVPVRASASG